MDLFNTVVVQHNKISCSALSILGECPFTGVKLRALEGEFFFVHDCTLARGPGPLYTRINSFCCGEMSGKHAGAYGLRRDILEMT